MQQRVTRTTRSDKNNQDCYVEIFRPDIKLNVYFGGKLGMTANDVQDMIRQYKAFGAAKVSFHMNGQQSVDFIDETHATGTCYALATLVTEQDGKDVLTTHAVRYYDKYEKILHAVETARKRLLRMNKQRQTGKQLWQKTERQL